MGLPDLIRSAIIASGRTQSDLAEAADVAQPHLSRFLANPKADMTATTAGKLLSALGLEVRRRKRRKR